MATDSVSQRREVLRQQVYRALLDSLRALPSYKHAMFVSSVIGELIDSEVQDLKLLVDVIDRVRVRIEQTP